MITKNERRVLSLLADGLTTRDISRAMGCCDSMASMILNRIYRKFGLLSLPNDERYYRAIMLFLSGEAML